MLYGECREIRWTNDDMRDERLNRIFIEWIKWKENCYDFNPLNECFVFCVFIMTLNMFFWTNKMPEVVYE